MAREIIIDFPTVPSIAPSVHQIRNFGEDLYRLFRDGGWASISLGDVDRATDRLSVKVQSKRQVRRVMAQIEKVLDQHLLANRARLTVVVPLD